MSEISVKYSTEQFKTLLRDAAREACLTDDDTEKLVAVARPGYRFYPGSYERHGLKCPVASAYTFINPVDAQVSPPAEDLVWERVANAIDARLPNAARSLSGERSAIIVEITDQGETHHVVA